MAFVTMQRGNLLIVAFLSVAMFCCYTDASEAKLQGQSIVRAFSCFDNKRIYNECGEAFRLNPSGNINIPMEATDLFCSGPCLVETQLVLNCIDEMLSNFVFYNKATVQQMRDALNAGCSYSQQRGNFNLGDYIGQETNAAHKLPILTRFYFFILTAAAIQFV